ncbi:MULTISPECIES: hypothetical protein [Helicobacter]|uniref:hypothetical protein n=1 Tax=Helicobacter TaxID=209 RepID=UPI0003DDF462|nr:MULTISPECIES: hypothetical protein [Helicobacter]CCM12434.1 hypothetical protein BN341_p50 [Helicobacter heilmannii ASB1.4]BDQ28149.1 hypothetical protein ASB1_18250 [Helicobacter heilmannii]BEG58213.1 hypothetical protein NHP21005_19010 [Helicobacter sp. NHP21005]BEG58233.1 hypothetical protein NHP21005_19210 [Helicobacter sp. NHP21005]BEG58252.1 hypothetical protein NHP21005_19400 [Helicobacter sp. NHP21005]
MAIGSAEIRSGALHVRDEKGKQLFQRTVSSTDVLVGFTATSVTLKRSGGVYTYDEKGHQTGFHVG